MTKRDQVESPLGDDEAAWRPCTGNGFTASKNIVLPEYRFVKGHEHKFIEGDRLEIIDSDTGIVKTTFLFKDGKWRYLRGINKSKFRN